MPLTLPGSTEVGGFPDIHCDGISHVGPAREENQDAIRLPEERLSAARGRLYALADGMGGYANGSLASALALEKLFDVFYGGPYAPAPRILRRGVETANLSVFQTAQRLGVGRMGTTLTAACIVGNRLHLAHVGDSRAYLIRGNRGTCLTNDHTTVGELVRAKVLSPQQVRTHAQRSVLTKGVGLSLFVRPDLSQHTLQDDDCLILCSDGVWSVIEDEEFVELAKRRDEVESLSRCLIDLAIDRQSDDNVSVVVIGVRRIASSPAQHRRGWRFSLRDLLP